MMEISIYQEVMTITNINTADPQIHEAKITELKGKMDNSITVVSDCNTLSIQM